MSNKSECLSTSQPKVHTLITYILANFDLYLHTSTYLTTYNFYSLRVHPLVIAAHPSEPNQFALGLTDGGVHILEPLESEGKWGTSPPIENGAGPSTASGAAGSDQPQR